MATQTFGKYIVTRHLGRGGMAEVYCAHHPALDREVAVKVIHPYLASEEGFTTRFCREAKLVASLRHPNIVQLYDFDVVNDQPFMVMEFLGGGTLKERLAGYRADGTTMPLDQVARLLAAVASALDYAHARGAIHRDIKPANILFTAQSEPVLCDFGISKIMAESAQISLSGSVIGTPAYMSPEQAASKAVDARSDLYSLGIVLYEMVTGRVPFEGDSPTAVMLQHLTTPPPPPRQFNLHISEPLQAVILKALAKDPAARFQSGNDLVRAFDAALRGGVPAPEKIVSTQAPTAAEKKAAPNIVATRAPTAVPPLPAKTRQVSPSPKSSPVRPRRLIHPVLAVMLVAVLGLIFIGMLTGLLFLAGFLRVSFSSPQPTGIAQATAMRSPVPAIAITSATPTLTPRPSPIPTVAPSPTVGSFGAIIFAPGVMGSGTSTKPVDPAARFPEGITRVFTVFSVEGTIRGNQWRYERYLDGKLQTDLSDKGWDLIGPSMASASLWSAEGIRAGDWEFRLYVMDQLVQKGIFTIERTKPGTASFAVIRFAEGINNNQPVNPHKPIDGFKTSTTQVYAFFDAANMTKQSNWKWQWYRDGKLIENVGGAKTWTGGQTEKDWWVKISDDKGLTPGTYELKLYVEDKLVQLGTCVVEQ